MQKVIINDQTTAEDFRAYLEDEKPEYSTSPCSEGLSYLDNEYDALITSQYTSIVFPPPEEPKKSDYDNPLIFGKNTTEGIVSIEVLNDKVQIFLSSGEVLEKPMVYWILSDKPLTRNATRLEGSLHYKYIHIFRTSKAKSKCYSINKAKNRDMFLVWNDKEAAMIYYGYTMFKGLKVSDVSVLSFDIEGAGLTRDENSQVFLITNTFRDNTGNLIKKHFRVDHYKNDVEMIEDWCRWVVEVDPTVITGHNIYGYDIPYLQHCYAERDGSERRLPLGKYGDPLDIPSKTSELRVDGNQTWEYTRYYLYGRHIVDGMFLAVRYDIGRNFPSWGLKPIVDYISNETKDIIRKGKPVAEANINLMERQEGRQFYDASKIGENWPDPIEREKIVAYGIDDSDDSLGLYDIMISSIFYMTQSVPKDFQLMTLSASGAQLNSILVRAYLQDNHSIPKAMEKEYVAGGMSYGIPGVYKNVVKFDAKSFYPSTILAFDIYDEKKDPKAYFLEMVRYFTHKRFEQKDKYKETNDKYYDDLQAASKVFINSSYGLLGTKGLNFNSYENAQLITKYCRASLQKTILWATGKDVDYWWGVDEKLYKKIKYKTEQSLIDKYEDAYEIIDETYAWVPKSKSGENWMTAYKHKRTATQDLPNFGAIDAKAKTSAEKMNQHNWHLTNIDTDALSWCKQDHSPFDKDELKQIVDELNDIMYSEWEDDGYYENFLVIKAKNYIVQEKGETKRKHKGSSITDSKKEPALLEMIQDIINDLIDNQGKNLVSIYRQYCREAADIQDIHRWATKKSVTKAVLNPERTNEQVVYNAIKHLNPREGDKFFLYTAIDGMRQKVVKGEPVFLKNGEPSLVPNHYLKHVDDYTKDQYREHYLERVYKTVKIFENVVDMDKFVKYYLKTKKLELEELLDENNN